MAQIKVRSGANVADTFRRPSNQIFWDLDERVLRDEGGLYIFEDFINLSLVDNQSPYQLIEGDAGASIGQTLDERFGVIDLTTGGTDNDEAYLGMNDDAAGVVRITSGGPAVGFEARLKVDAILGGSVIVGLVNEAEVAADLLADTQTDAAILDTSAPDFIGFITAADTDPDGFDAAYMDQATVGAHIVHNNTAHTWVADTYVKAGFKYDPVDEVIRYYINGNQVGTDLAINTAEVPDGEELMFAIGAKADDTAGKIVELDWFCVAMGPED